MRPKRHTQACGVSNAKSARTISTAFGDAKDAIVAVLVSVFGVAFSLFSSHF
jgi:hypothetical protein